MIRDPMVVQEVTDEYVTFTHNKSTFAIILTEKTTLVFILPKDSTKLLYKGNLC